MGPDTDTEHRAEYTDGTPVWTKLQAQGGRKTGVSSPLSGAESERASHYVF